MSAMMSLFSISLKKDRMEKRALPHERRTAVRGYGLLAGLAAFASIVMAPACRGGGTIEFHDVNIVIRPAALQVELDYKHGGAKKIEAVNFYVRKGKKELCLMSPATSGVAGTLMKGRAGHLSLTIPTPYLPAGRYELLLKSTVRGDEGNRCLKSSGGRSLLRANGYTGANYELHCLVAGSVAPFVRGQEGLSQSAASWNFYYAGGGRSGSMAISAFKDNKWFTVCGPTACKPSAETGWLDFTLRCNGDQLELALDGQRLSGKDAKAYFAAGHVGFRSGDQGVAYVDNVTVTDLDTGKMVFSDDFERDVVGDKWKTCGGAWEISRGIPIVEETALGAFNMPEQGASALPKVEVRRRGDGMDMLVDGAPVVPLFFSLAATGSGSAYKESSYEVMRNAYSAGIRFFAPIVTITAFDKDGHMDLSLLDDIMAQALAACPGSYFVLRMALPPPPWLPANERMMMAKDQGAAAKAGGFEDTKVEKGFDASLASEGYKAHFRKEVKRVIAHMKSCAYGKSVLGTLATGGGYELNWGQPVVFPGYLIDVSPAQVKHVGKALKDKYGSLGALRAAWDDGNASFDAPSLPGLEDRSGSDIAGFRDSAVGKSRRVLDFLDIYCSESDENLKVAFDAVQEAAPNSFFGSFYTCTVNSEWGGAGAGFGGGTTRPLLNHPGAKFVAGILFYTDRRAGGVSVNTSMTWESFRMHGKMLLSENDIRTPVTSELITEASWADAAQTMRREFSNTVLMERNAMWYFDMGYTGPWFDNPMLLDEMSKEMAVGKAALGVERKNMAETLVVLDPNAWRYYASTTEKLREGEKPPFNCIVYPLNYNTLAVEAMMRMGAPKDFILPEDLPLKDGYKLYIFPTAFHCDSALRERVAKLANDGAVCVFMGPAGLVDDKSASLENMESLLGMKVAFDGPMPLAASMIPSTHPLAAGFTGKETIGAGDYVRCFNMDYLPTWYRFYVDGDIPGVEPLAKYNTPAGKVAMAVRRVGKGAIVYSGVPITHPGVYRNIAKFAGVHVYSDTDDALYADGNFLMIHTKDAGKKKLKLREKAPEIREVFSGELIGRNVDEFEVELPAKHTALYYIGKDDAFLKRLDGLAHAP